MRLCRRAAGVALLAIAAIAAATTLAVAASSPAVVLTGTIDRTYSLGQCQGPAGCFVCNQQVDLDLVRLRVDESVPVDALKANAGCTGRIGKVDIVTQGADGIKIAANAGGDARCESLDNCVHDLVIGGGTVASAGIYPGSHQDCFHAMGGYRISVTGVVFACAYANNAQWFLTVNKQSSTPTPPVDVICNQCEFWPGPSSYHSVTIGPSKRSGVMNSLVCAGTVQNLQFDVDPSAADVIDWNNTRPWPSC
jgi:hypothetical protein